MLIGISGKIGSGKDTIGNIIQYLTLHKAGGYTYKPNNEEFLDLMKTFKLTGFMPVFANNVESTWEIKKFAWKLKKVVALLTGCLINDLEDQEFKKQELSREWWNYLKLNTGTPQRPTFISYPAYATDEVVKELGEDRITKPTYRTMLQLVGTEAMRNQIHENIWVNALFADYKKNQVLYDHNSKENLSYYLNTPQYPNWIITDMRFPNELKAIEERNGITIRVERFSKDRFKEVKDEHPSETALDNAKFKYVIGNDGTVEELVEKIRFILINESVI